MSRRDIRSTSQMVNEIMDGRLAERTRIAYLATDLVSSARQVLIQFSDPMFTRGATVKAEVGSGIDLSGLAIGTPLTVITRHGRAQVVGLSAGNLSTVGSGQIERVYASKASSQTISNNSTVVVTFDTNDAITSDDFHDTTANTSRFVAARGDGCYHVSCWVRYNVVSATGRMLLILRDSSGNQFNTQRVEVATSSTAASIAVGTDFDLVADDWIDWAVYQNTGASQDITSARATMRYVGA